MTDSRAAVGFDRLPWLTDEPNGPRRERSGRELAGWLVAGALVVAGASYWLGQRTDEPLPPPAARSHSTTVPLPTPVIVEPQVVPDRVPQVEPVRTPSVSVPRPRVERYVARRPP